MLRTGEFHYNVINYKKKGLDESSLSNPFFKAEFLNNYLTIFNITYDITFLSKAFNN